MAYAVVWVFLLFLLNVGLAYSVTVQSSSEFAAVLKDNLTSSIIVAGDFQIQSGDFPGQFTLQRNVTVASSDPFNEAAFWRIDFNLLQARMHIAPGVTIEFHWLNLFNTRYGPSYNLDFFGFSPGGIIYLNHAMKQQLACAPADLAGIQALPVPTDGPYPADFNHNVSLLDTYSIRGKTWHQVLEYHTYAIIGTQSSVDGVSDAGGYVILKNECFKTCDVFATTECIQQQGPDSCVVAAINAQLASNNGSNSTATTNSSSSHTTAIAAGVAAGVGGTVVIAVVVLVVLWLKKRKALGLGASSVYKPQDIEHGKSGGPMSSSKDDKLKCSSDFDSFSYCSNNLGRKLSCEASGEQATFIKGFDDQGQRFFIEVQNVLLGSGSFGAVYKGRYNDQVVAVKEIQHPPSVADKVGTEVALMLSFKHRNVVRALQYVNKLTVEKYSRNLPMRGGGRTSAVSSSSQVTSAASGSTASSDQSDAGRMQTWIVLEYCDLGSLGNAMDKGMFQLDGKPMMGLILSRLLDIAEGMAYVHQQKICHGDLKVANVLLATDHTDKYGSCAKVGDFGLSRAMINGQTHLSTRTFGTVSHMAPELLKNGKLMPQGDVYSFGMMMWELATGRSPYRGLMFGQVIERVVAGKRLTFPTYIPAAFCALARECWAAQPQQRPTFPEVAQRLRELLQQEPELQALTDSLFVPGEALPDEAGEDGGDDDVDGGYGKEKAHKAGGARPEKNDTANE